MCFWTSMVILIVFVTLIEIVDVMLVDVLCVFAIQISMVVDNVVCI